VLPAIVLSLFVLIGNPLIVMAIMGYMGYRRRTGFMAGLTVAQISEFSIVFVAMGITLGHVGVAALSLTTLVGLVTITASTYMILYAQPLYERLSPWLRIFERAHPQRETGGEPALTQAPDAIVIGLGRYGRRLAQKLHEEGVRVLGVDFDPEVAEAPPPAGIEVRFGDAQDPEFLESLPLAHTPWVISTVPDLHSNRLLLRALAERGYGGDLAIVARDDATGAALKSAGVPIVLYPVRNAVDFAVEHLSELMQAARPKPDKETP
jgi:hypothetical protein